MEEIAINICDICNLKDLSGLTLFNKNLHIAACQKKADKLIDSSCEILKNSFVTFFEKKCFKSIFKTF